MWIKQEDLVLKVHSEEVLTEYKNTTGKEYSVPAIKVREDCTVIPVNKNWMDVYYDNVESCTCDNIYIKKDCVRVVTPTMRRSQEDPSEYMMAMFQNGYNLLQTYGVTDMLPDTEECFANVFEQYPDLKLITEAGIWKFALVFTAVEGDFRFHKNGGYRGKDEVGEHVSDSPAEEYLMFCLVYITSEGE